MRIKNAARLAPVVVNAFKFLRTHTSLAVSQFQSDQHETASDGVCVQFTNISRVCSETWKIFSSFKTVDDRAVLSSFDRTMICRLRALKGGGCGACWLKTDSMVDGAFLVKF